MKRQWLPEELVEHFSLLPDDLSTLDSKEGTNQLGFAVWLKFFQYEARFPRSRQEIPKAVVSYIAKQLSLSPRLFRDYGAPKRTTSRHRVEIREFFRFREATLEDARAMKDWLCQRVLIYDRNEVHLEEALYQHFRQLKLVPPSHKQMLRLIRSAARSAETAFGQKIHKQLSSITVGRLDDLLTTETETEAGQGFQLRSSAFSSLKTDPGKVSVDSLIVEIEKLSRIRQLRLPPNLFETVPPKVIKHYRRRASAEAPRDLRRHPKPIRYTLLAAFCVQRSQEITDSLLDLLIQIIHRLHINAERKVDKQLVEEFKRVDNKPELLYRIADATLKRPDEPVKTVVYPIAEPQTLESVVQEYQASKTYQQRVYTVMRGSYLHHYRRMVPHILETLKFRSNNESHRPVILALDLLKRNQDSKQRYYTSDDHLYTEGVLKSGWRKLVVEPDAEGNDRVNRVNYEICVLQALRNRLRSKEIWVEGAKRYGDPETDLPQDFEDNREVYYQALKQPLDAENFIAQLQQDMTQALTLLNQHLPKNPLVQIGKRRGQPWITVSPLEKQAESPNLRHLKREIKQRWPMTGLLDVLKETDLRVNFTEQFRSSASRETLDPKTIRLCIM